MASKKEIVKRLKAAGIEHDADASTEELEALLPEEEEEEEEEEKAPAPKKDAPSDFSWAANRVKLNRSIAHVNATAPELTGNGREAAVRERYIAIKGLVIGEEIARRGKGGRTENVAANDEE